GQHPQRAGRDQALCRLGDATGGLQAGRAGARVDAGARGRGADGHGAGVVAQGDVAAAAGDAVGREDRPDGEADVVPEAKIARQVSGQGGDVIGGVVQGEIARRGALEQQAAGGGDPAGHAGGVVGRQRDVVRGGGGADAAGGVHGEGRTVGGAAGAGRD